MSDDITGTDFNFMQLKQKSKKQNTINLKSIIFSFIFLEKVIFPGYIDPETMINSLSEIKRKKGFRFVQQDDDFFNPNSGVNI